MPGGRPPLSEDVLAVRVELGQRIRQARHNAGLTLDDISAATGLVVRRIAEWEAGQRPLPSETLLVLAHACGVTGAHLLGEQRRMIAPAA